ncbi:MAG: DUF1294 domain-containing protein [Bacteroidales bacterium]|nr:DUF1294 domain-containing protein [Bacteroidales bacterium]
MTLKLLIILAAINLFSFLRVAFDKNLASKNAQYKSEKDIKKRISEVSLVAISSFGGALGTLIAFQVFKHKSSGNKSQLRKSLYLVLFQNVIMWVALIILASNL